MQLIQCLLPNFYLNMFRASLCPSSGEQDRVLPQMVFCTGCPGCGCVELGREVCALCEISRKVTFTQCTQLASQLHTNHNQHNQFRTPYAVAHGLVLLMMRIMMPETCWDRSVIINIRLVAPCWFLSLQTISQFSSCYWNVMTCADMHVQIYRA